MKLFQPRAPGVKFLCASNDWDVIPKPYPARQYTPDWFKALPMKLGDQGLNTSTIKRCNPFMDAMGLGWIIPLAADVTFVSNEDGSGVDYRWTYDKVMVENHTMEQVSSPKKPNPAMPRPPMKFMNYWLAVPDDGFSLLFMPPLNRPDPRFTLYSGLVDSDRYTEFVNFPFFLTPGFTGTIEAGTPLAQVVPIRRSDLGKKADVGRIVEWPGTAGKLETTRRRRLSHESLYRDTLRVKK